MTSPTEISHALLNALSSAEDCEMQQKILSEVGGFQTQPLLHKAHPGHDRFNEPLLSELFSSLHLPS